MKNISEVTPVSEPEWPGEPLHVFDGRSGTGLEMHVYAHHVEIHSPRDRAMLALWYRHIRTLVPTHENGSAALAIIDGGGQVIEVPMASDDVGLAKYLIESLIAWDGRQRL